MPTSRSTAAVWVLAVVIIVCFACGAGMAASYGYQKAVEERCQCIEDEG